MRAPRVQKRVAMQWADLHRALPWEAFQVAAIGIGATLVGRGNLRAFAVGVAASIAGGLALGMSGMGALAGLVAGYAIAKRGRDLDALAPAIAAMIAVARLGCFAAGCDFGTPTASPLAIAYPPDTPAFLAQRLAGLVHDDATRTLPVHPTQLYEALVGVVAFVVARRSLPAVLAIYAVGRFAVDGVRGDLARVALGLTASQLMALGALALLVAWRAERLATSP